MYSIFDTMIDISYIMSNEPYIAEGIMTHEERNNLVSIFTGILVQIYISYRIWSQYADGVFDGPDGLMLWARTILWIIPVAIIAMIISVILFAILHAIVTGNPKPSFIVDERDKSIGRTGNIVTMVVSSIGFIIALICLALGWSAFAAFNILFYSFAAGDFSGNLTKQYLWRRGM